MAFNGNEGEVITLTQGKNWTKNFRNAHPNEIKAHFFGKNKLNQILNQSGCVGIRIYNAIDDQGKKVLVLVGVDDQERDLTNGIILERSMPCPPMCDIGSLLYNDQPN